MSHYPIGTRVVPIKKTAGRISFKDCPYWKEAKRRNQPFLYVVDHYDGRHLCHYGEEVNENSPQGNYYNYSDLVPFESNKEKLFELLVQATINDETYAKMMKLNDEEG